MLNLGNAYATVGLDHTEFDRGVQHVGSGVDTIIGHLGRIGDVVIGVTLAQSLEGLLQKLGDVPRKLVSINAEMETIGLGMAAHLENASKLVASTIEGAGAELAEATHKESLRLERVVQSMKDAQDDLQRRRDEVQTRRNVSTGDVDSQLTRATASHEERVNEIVRSQRHAAEDLTERNSSAFGTMTRQVKDYNERWAEGVTERSRVFNQSIGDLAANHGRALAKLSSDMSDAASQFQDKIADAASNAATRLSDLSEKHSAAVRDTEQDILRSERNYSQDLLVRQTKLGEQVRDIGERYADATRKVTDEGAKAAEDFAQRVQDIQANASRALEGLRISEAQATLRFQFNQRQLQRQLSRASTPDQRAELQDRLQYTQAEEALRQQAAQRQITDVENRRRKENEAAEKTLRDVGKKGEDRVKQEAEQRDRQVRNAIEAYSREVFIAQRAHQQQAEDLRKRLADEQTQYLQQTTAIAREQAKQVQNATRTHEQRVASLARSIADEDAQYQQQSAKLRADFAARNEQADQQRARQIADAEAQYEREARAAQLAYERISENNADRAERETRAYSQHLDDIDRRATDTRNRIDADAAQAETIYERRIRDLGIQYQEAERAFKARYNDAAGDILARNSQVANLFSTAWVEATNAMFKAQDLRTGGPAGGRQNYFTETSDIMERQTQIMDVLREEAFKLPGTFQQIAKSAQQMMGFGLDPFEKGLYRIVAGLSLMPGAANVGTEGIIRAFGQLRAGATGQAERIFREIGVPLRQIPGLLFNAANELKTELPEAWKIVLDYFGPKTDVILKHYESSWVVLTSNLQELFENLMRIAGEPLFKNTKAFLQQLYIDIVQHGPEIKKAAADIGEGLGNFVTGIYNFIRKLTDPATLGYFQQLGAIMGRTVENIQAFAQGIAEALAGAKTSQGLSTFVRDTLRVIERISAVFADPQMIRSFAIFLQTLGEVKDEALRIIGDFVAGLAGVSRADAQGGLVEFVQNLTIVALKVKDALVNISEADARKAAETVIEFARDVAGAIGGLVSFLRDHGDELKILGTIFIGLKVGEAAFGFLSFIYKLAEAFRVIGPAAGIVTRLSFLFSGLSLAVTNFGTALAGIFSTMGTAIATFRAFLPFTAGIGARLALLASTILPAATSGVVALAGAIGTSLFGALASVATFIGLSGPVGIGIIAITALIAALTVAWLNNWGDIQGKTTAVIHFFSEGLLPRLGEFKDGVIAEMQKVADNVGIIAEGLKTVWDAIFGPWVEAFGKLKDQITAWFDENGEEAKTRASTFIEGIYNGLAAAIGLFFPATWVSQLLGKAIFEKVQEFWTNLGDEQQKWVTGAFEQIPLAIIKWLTGASLIEALAKVTTVITEWVKSLDDNVKKALKEVVIGAFSLAFGGLAPIVSEALHKVYGSGVLGEWLDKLAVQGPSRIEDIAGRMGENFGRIADGIDGIVERGNASLSGLGTGINQTGIAAFGDPAVDPVARATNAEIARNQNRGYGEPLYQMVYVVDNPNGSGNFQMIDRRTGRAADGNAVIPPGGARGAAGASAAAGGGFGGSDSGGRGGPFGPLAYSEVNGRGFAGLGPLTAGNATGSLVQVNDGMSYTGPGGTFQVYRRDDGGYGVSQTGGRAFDVKGGVSPWAYGYGAGGSAPSMPGGLDAFYNMIAGLGPQSYGSDGTSGEAYSMPDDLLTTLNSVRGAQDTFSTYINQQATMAASRSGPGSPLNMLAKAASQDASKEPDRLRAASSGLIRGAPGDTSGSSYSKAPGGLPGYNTEGGGGGGEGQVQVNNFNNPTFNDGGIEAVGALVGESWRQFRTP